MRLQHSCQPPSQFLSKRIVPRAVLAPSAKGSTGELLKIALGTRVRGVRLKFDPMRHSVEIIHLVGLRIVTSMTPTRSRNTVIPVVDLFAGPGGLGEGFSAFERRGTTPFEVHLSIEKDPVACATLALRKFFRQFDAPPAEFAAYLSGRLSKSELFGAYPIEAQRAQGATWQAELGKATRRSVSNRVRRALAGTRNWVLLGGPPCQAYSIAGRSRMRSTRPDFEQDERHFLYQEYLRIVANHEPAIFVLENVKGLLTSKHGGNRIVNRILGDLGAPGKALRIPSHTSLLYRLYPLARQQAVLPWMEDGPKDGEEFLLQAEHYGIPQTRHRIFIVGVRSDVAGRPEGLNPQAVVPTGSVLSDLPPIRSLLSREKDSLSDWHRAIADIRTQKWMSSRDRPELVTVARDVRETLKLLRSSALDPGAGFMKYTGSPAVLGDWYRRNTTGLTQHRSRAHMREDLQRYLFCACFAKIHRKSPKLRDFPRELYPSHRNVPTTAEANVSFEDRFRVQIADRPSSTITSHVSKDGHYYIHYDPAQCRSLTVREAARLQTFPDSYYFEGTQTEQYHQIGNAVPPYLARGIAEVIFELLSSTDNN